jgi:rare lipoprotein A
MIIINFKKVFRGGLYALLAMSLGLTGCNAKEEAGAVAEAGKDKAGDPSRKTHKEVGEASWYGPGFHGKKTASGEIYDQEEMTAAHPTLPLGTEAEVTNLENKKKIEVEITDRGPYAKDRAIDLSKEAAEKLDIKEEGVGKVKIEAAKPAGKEPSSQTGTKSSAK